MKYYIPIIGWAIAVREWHTDMRELMRANEAGVFAIKEIEKTLVSFDKTRKGFISTAAFLMLLLGTMTAISVMNVQACR